MGFMGGVVGEGIGRGFIWVGEVWYGMMSALHHITPLPHKTIINHDVP